MKKLLVLIVLTLAFSSHHLAYAQDVGPVGKFWLTVARTHKAVMALRGNIAVPMAITAVITR